jgi:hypothetical protein
VGSIVTCDDPLDAVAYQEDGESWGLQGNPDPTLDTWNPLSRRKIPKRRRFGCRLRWHNPDDHHTR